MYFYLFRIIQIDTLRKRMTAIENFHSSISSTHIDLVHIPTGRICFAKSSNSHSNRSKHLTTNKSMISVSRRIEHRKHLLHRL